MAKRAKEKAKRKAEREVKKARVGGPKPVERHSPTLLAPALNAAGVTLVPDYLDIPELRKDFARLVQEVADLHARIKPLEERYDFLRDELEAELVAVDQEAVGCGVYRVNRVVKEGSKRIDRAKLIMLGVDPALVDKATVVGKSSSYATVKKIG